jgi:hypothetical protein
MKVLSMARVLGVFFTALFCCYGANSLVVGYKQRIVPFKSIQIGSGKPAMLSQSHGVLLKGNSLMRLDSTDRFSNSIQDIKVSATNMLIATNIAMFGVGK